MNRRQFIDRSVITLIGCSLAACLDGNKLKIQKNQTIGCFGDSITFAGGRRICRNTPRLNSTKTILNLNIKFLNYGKSSETVSGLTEEDHPGPRPYLFERLDGLLDKTPY